MYADNTLTPKETVRFCALGLLTDGPRTYSELAISIRHFIDRIQGASLDVLGTSVELLKYEGLIITFESDGDNTLQITDKGHKELITLLTANIRANSSDQNKLIEALKFRFFHLLDRPKQSYQTDLLIDRAEQELLRLFDLRDHYIQEPGHIVDWLDQGIGELEGRLKWLCTFKSKVN
jgi:DNA-binding PadR family transcriptional regulator